MIITKITFTFTEINFNEKIFNHSNAATISGSELKERISEWLKTRGANTQVEILDNIKYPYCNEKDL